MNNYKKALGLAMAETEVLKAQTPARQRRNEALFRPGDALMGRSSPHGSGCAPIWPECDRSHTAGARHSRSDGTILRPKGVE